MARRKLIPLCMMQIIPDLGQKWLAATWIHHYKECFGRSFRTTMAICGLRETRSRLMQQADSVLLHVRCDATSKPPEAKVRYDSTF
jgi:hypothetical protein